MIDLFRYQLKFIKLKIDLKANEVTSPQYKEMLARINYFSSQLVDEMVTGPGVRNERFAEDGIYIMALNDIIRETDTYIKKVLKTKESSIDDINWDEIKSILL